MIALTCEEMLVDYRGTAERWLTFFAAHPAALDVPSDIARSRTVGELVWHIYSVSVRHSQRLLGEEVHAFADGPDSSLENIRALLDESEANLRRFLAATTPEHFDEQFDYVTRTGGRLRSSYRKLFVHIMVHAIRHLAQISTLVRQHGFDPGWPQDFLASKALC